MTSIDNPYQYVKDNLSICRAIYVLENRHAVPGKNTNCPSRDHADKNPSCSIDKDDKVFHCKSCDAKGTVIDLIAVNKGLDKKTACNIGLEMCGVTDYKWPSNGNKPSSNGSKKTGKTFDSQPSAKKEESGASGDKKDKTLKTARAIERDRKVEEYQAKCEAFYDYTDYDGNPAFRVFRLPGKEFRQTTWNGKIYVNFKAIDAPQYLYNAQAVRESTSCVIVEGEKDADALIKLGIVATTWPGGANNLKALLDTWDLFEPLRGKEVVWFAPDPDDAGEKAFEEAVPFINGYVDEFRKVKWPGVKDAHDFVSQFSDDATAKDEAWNVLLTSPEYVPPMDISNVLCRANRVRTLDIPPPEWIVQDMIPVGYTLVAGRSKARKTMFLHNLAIAVAQGSIAIGKFPTTKGTVIYCSLEDDISSWKAKLTKMLGDEPWPEKLLGTFDVVRFPALETKIREWKRAFPDLKMVILDNLTLIKKIKGGAGGGQDYDAEYIEQSHFKKFARKLGIALVVVHHAGKHETGDISKDVLGTTAFIGAPDKLILIQKPVNEDQYNNILSFMNRNSADQERMALKFHSDSLTFNYIGPLEDFERTDLEEQVLDLLSGNGKPMGPAQIARTLGRDPQSSATSKLLKRMEAKGLVKSARRGLYEYVEPKASQSLYDNGDVIDV